MLHEYTDLINELKKTDARFAALCKKHDELNKKIDDNLAKPSEIDNLKKEKLKLKDEIYAQILSHLLELFSLVYQRLSRLLGHFLARPSLRRS